MTVRFVCELTRRALSDIDRIHLYSEKNWGKSVADKYIADIDRAFQSLAGKPEQGRSRRAAPFLMISVRRHFVVYERQKSTIIILTILHQNQHVEQIIATLRPAFIEELKALKPKP